MVKEMLLPDAEMVLPYGEEMLLPDG